MINDDNCQFIKNTVISQSVMLLFNLSFSRMYAHFSIESFEPNESRRDNVSVP